MGPQWRGWDIPELRDELQHDRPECVAERDWEVLQAWIPGERKLNEIGLSMGVSGERVRQLAWRGAQSLRRRRFMKASLAH